MFDIRVNSFVLTDSWMSVSMLIYFWLVHFIRDIKTKAPGRRTWGCLTLCLEDGCRFLQSIEPGCWGKSANTFISVKQNHCGQERCIVSICQWSMFDEDKLIIFGWEKKKSVLNSIMPFGWENNYVRTVSILYTIYSKECLALILPPDCCAQQTGCTLCRWQQDLYSFIHFQLSAVMNLHPCIFHFIFFW